MTQWATGGWPSEAAKSSTVPRRVPNETPSCSLNMSASSLHHHFREITAMSPLQYQKLLRLHEARRLLLTEGCDVATAAHRVGYESPSQFSREYSRQHGAPPLRDVNRLRSAGGDASSMANTH